MTRALDEPHFELDVRPDPSGHTTIVAAGEVDVASAEELRDTLSEHLRRGPVLLDLREVTFMDSSGVAAVTRALRDTPDAALTVCSELHRNVRQILELTGVLEMLTLEPCDGEA